MCRVAGYVGPPLRLGELVSAPAHSLLVQSYRPREMQSGTVNADGWGAALWLDDGEAEPAVYRSVSPIWADPNLGWLGQRMQVRAALAAVRSATPGIGFEMANVQPFAAGRVAFLHNGFISGFRHGMQRALREGLGEKAYESILGGSDSEVIFALVLDRLERGAKDLADAVRGAVSVLGEACKAHDRRAVATLLLSDGEQLVGCRWAQGHEPASLYVGPLGEGVCVASEPLDAHEWRKVGAGELLIARPGRPPALEALG